MVLPNLAVNKTYSLTIDHVQRVTQMAEERTLVEGKPISQGEILRRAIDLLFEQYRPAGSATPSIAK